MFLSEHPKHVGQEADVAQKVELHINLKILTLKAREGVLDVGIVDLRTLHAGELVEEGLSWR